MLCFFMTLLLLRALQIEVHGDRANSQLRVRLLRSQQIGKSQSVSVPLLQLSVLRSNRAPRFRSHQPRFRHD